jgi:hypothetical protein
MRVGSRAHRGRQSRRQISWCVVFLILLAAAGCNNQPAVPTPVPHVDPTATQAQAPTATQAQEEPIAARVNGQPIYLRDYQKQVTEWEAAFITQNANLNDQQKQEMS